MSGFGISISIWNMAEVCASHLRSYLPNFNSTWKLWRTLSWLRGFLQYIMTRFRTIFWSMTRDFIFLDVSIWMILSVWSPTMHKHNMNTGNTRVPTSTMQAFTYMRTRVPPGRVQRIAANTQPKQAQSRSLAAETKWERQSSGGQRLSDVINTQLLRRS